ncbi:GNAT family N-acetyltransferase [Pelomonas sp. APW6]|uniref:GNAT family N-acetyltransferase n=1 Tax=Roseateles subflavus TaxID=3053353 RepID=A0ABT7LE88_9BURK|nr:GNAT family N-acetyltransferase [Pelomonas sp. APW6]MDL5031168.1 GNAT family N-acetyltransferase [Pelomonas sp. APW6]
MSPSVTLICADAVPAASLHEAFTAAFADYLIGPFVLPPEAWPGFLARQGIDLALSRVAVDGQGRPLAFAFTAPRPARSSWRLGTMGALPAARGSGAAPALLADFLARARAAGCEQTELEVFAQNERARRLYERHGFETRDLLQGWAGTVPPGPGVGWRELAWNEALAWLDAAEAEGLALPLQQTRLGLASAQGQRAFAWGGALVTGAPRPDDDGCFQLSAVVDRDPSQADLRALLQALAAAHPGWRHWRMPQLLRPSVGGEALASLGLGAEPLHQLWMRRVG